MLQQHQRETRRRKMCLWGQPVEQRLEEREVADYDWKEERYPLYLTKNVPDDVPLGLTVFYKKLVLYRDGPGKLRCYQDRCPHRLAKISEGQLVDGRLECLYHGWQFEVREKCVQIPQELAMYIRSGGERHGSIGSHEEGTFCKRRTSFEEYEDDSAERRANKSARVETDEQWVEKVVKEGKR